MGLRGFLWVSIMGSQNEMGLDYGSDISVTDVNLGQACCLPL